MIKYGKNRMDILQANQVDVASKVFILLLSA